MPAVVTEQRTFGIEKAHARHCPICEVGWDGRYLTTCWLQADHPVLPGAPPLAQFRTVATPGEVDRPYTTVLDPRSY